MPRTIYLDTTLWNRLFEQEIDAALLTSTLKRQGWELAISPHLIYELAKSFRAKRAESRVKAIPLFSYLQRYLDVPIFYAKQPTELLREEVHVVLGALGKAEVFYQGSNRDRMTEEIRKLATGKIDPRLDPLLKFRTGQVADFRQTFRVNREMRAAEFTLDEYMRWGLDRFGVLALEKHIAPAFPDLLPKQVRWVARKVLSARQFRFCHAFVRADVYLNWIRSQGNSLRRDTLDDCYHVENAAYCDVYATDDAGQRDYADAILTVTTVRVHDKKAPLLEWLTTDMTQ